MARFRSVSESDVEQLGSWLGISFAAGERESAVDRVNGFGEVYRKLEQIDDDGADGGADAFGTPPSRAGADDDPHNAWITRFDLERPDADGPLDGLEVGVKDNIAVRGAEMTCGSHAYEGYVPTAHATVVDRLLDAGATVRGKTNMDELAFGVTSETSAFGPTTNPVDEDHVAGGSSSGSAALVASEAVDLALGTDTGGSVRIPASYCGIVGIKPTYGAVPLHGVVELARSLDHVGVLARDVGTAARGLSVIAEPTPGGDRPDYAGDLGRDAAGTTVGVPERYFEEHVSGDVERTVREALDGFEAEGAEVRSVDVPALEHSRPAFWGIIPTEFAAMYLTGGIGLWDRGRIERSLPVAHDRAVDGSKYGFSGNIKDMLALGAYVLAEQDGYHYVRGRNLQEELTDQFDAALADVDALAAPSTPTTALGLGEFTRGETAPPNWNTHPTDLTGHPSISIPCGTNDGLPVGLQLIGDWFDESTLLDVAREFERLT